VNFIVLIKLSSESYSISIISYNLII